MTFKDIKGYEGLYKISDTGIVFACEKKTMMPNGGFFLRKENYPSCFTNHKGYLKVNLTSKNRVRKGHFIHRLVGFAFIENNDVTRDQINHKDKNKKNNCVSNLEWVTNQENSIHKFDKTKTSSKFYGVCKKRNSYQAGICRNGKYIYLGSFKTDEEAGKAVKNYCNI